MAENGNDRPFLFIGGLQRSGTTLLGRLLAQHPDATGLVGTPTREDEGQFVQDVYVDDHMMGNPSGGTRGRVFRWAFHPEAHLTEADARTRYRAAERLLGSWAPYWENPDAGMYVEKSPSNVTRTRFLQELFPAARFIIITRHPIVQGLAARKWGGRVRAAGLRFDSFISHWLEAMETFERDRPGLNHATVVKYEDLIREPDRVLHELQEFAGLARTEIEAEHVTDGSERYREYWRAYSRPGTTLPDLGGRPDTIPGRARRLIERGVGATIAPQLSKRLVSRFEERVRRFGYTLTELE